MVFAGSSSSDGSASTKMSEARLIRGFKSGLLRSRR